MSESNSAMAALSILTIPVIAIIVWISKHIAKKEQLRERQTQLLTLKQRGKYVLPGIQH